MVRERLMSVIANSGTRQGLGTAGSQCVRVVARPQLLPRVPLGQGSPGKAGENQENRSKGRKVFSNLNIILRFTCYHTDCRLARVLAKPDCCLSYVLPVD